MHVDKALNKNVSIRRHIPKNLSYNVQSYEIRIFAFWQQGHQWGNF